MDNYNNAALAGIAGMIMTYFWVILALAVFIIVCHWKVYTKAGQPGWACIIPFYNYIVLLDIVGKPRWWLILMLIPLVNFIVAIIVLNELSKVFGKGTGFMLGLLFLPIIFYPILAFGDSTYTPPGNAA